VYSRTLDGNAEPTTFGVSGNLWHGVLVMYDRASESFWTQLDGRAIEGPMTGARLEHYPSTFTSWAQWKAEHPTTEALYKPEDAREQTESNYAAYFADPDRLFREQLSEGLGGIGPKDVVFGVVVDGVPFAVEEAVLKSERVVHAVVGNTPVAWVRNPATGDVRVVEAVQTGRVLLFGPADAGGTSFVTAEEEVVDLEELEPVRVDRAYWYAWARSHPGSRILAPYYRGLGTSPGTRRM
jgi:hypothetical protein